jgi:hypothetical protein
MLPRRRGIGATGTCSSGKVALCSGSPAGGPEEEGRLPCYRELHDSSARRGRYMAATDSDASATRRRTPVHLWVIGVVALLWSLVGAFDYLATQLRLEFYVGQFTGSSSPTSTASRRGRSRVGLLRSGPGSSAQSAFCCAGSVRCGHSPSRLPGWWSARSTRSSCPKAPR